MNKQVFAFLKQYSSVPALTDRLIISSFLLGKGIRKTKNRFVNDYIITENSAEYAPLQQFTSSHKIDSIEDLVSIFEFVVSPKDKIINGAVYTPASVRKYITEETLREIEGSGKEQSMRICDPACGCAGFLYSACIYLRSRRNMSFSELFRNHLFGLDTQLYSIKRSQLLLAVAAITEGEDEEFFHFNIFHGNALSFDWSTQVLGFSGFDAVIGNPPYVCSRNIDEESRNLLKNWSVCGTGHPDLYIPFFELGIKILRSGGRLGYITMNTFFRSINGRSLRKMFDDTKCFMKIIDFGGHQIFNSKSAYTCICFITKSHSDVLYYTRAESAEDLNLPNKLRFEAIPYSGLNIHDGWSLQERSLIAKIEATGTPLGQRFKSRNGIATLKNNIYVFTPVKTKGKFLVLADNDKEFLIEKKACRDIVNSNKLTNSTSINSIKEKIIFPYLNNADEASLIEEYKFKKLFPNAYAYLKTKKHLLALRDKGNGKYEGWYAYGRNQSLEKVKHKLLFPHIAILPSTYTLNADADLFFYNGMAIFGRSRRELLILKTLLSSKIFTFYVRNTSKPYSSDYYSLARNYIKKFGLCEFTKEEELWILRSDTTIPQIDALLETKYGITLPSDEAHSA